MDERKTLLWCLYTFALIYVLVFLPPSSAMTLEKTTDFGDPGGRVRHLALFLVEGYLSSSSFGKVGLYLSLTLGGATEGAQYFIPWRSCDPFDLAADFAGSLLGFLFYLLKTSRKSGEVGSLGGLHFKVNGPREENN